ncbi:hypothetical protein N7490_009414 [Penicillium lividum]|nr:hypothetical protein N7490_009414 [Penicillium lividum]
MPRICSNTDPLYVDLSYDCALSRVLQGKYAESLRVYNVLELHLYGALNGQPRACLAGNGLGKFSVADINAYPWEEMAQYTHLKEWIERIGSRPAVQRGMSDVYDEEVHPELLVNTFHK